MDEKEQLPILLKQALGSADQYGNEGNELIIDEIERHISDFKKLMNFSSKYLTDFLIKSLRFPTHNFLKPERKFGEPTRDERVDHRSTAKSRVAGCNHAG